MVAGTSDQFIWRICQAKGYYLLTDNRSETTADALGAVISTEGTAESLPVFTIDSMDRFRTERSYGEALVKSLLQHLFDRERIRRRPALPSLIGSICGGVARHGTQQPPRCGLKSATSKRVSEGPKAHNFKVLKFEDQGREDGLFKVLS